MTHELDTVIKLDEKFYKENFPKNKGFEDIFKDYEWYKRFVRIQRDAYDKVIDKLASEGASRQKIGEAKERYREVLKKYLEPTQEQVAEPSRPDLLDTILENDLPHLSLDYLLEGSAPEKVEGADLYRIRLEHLIIEGKTKEEVETTYKNFKAPYEQLAEKLAKSNPTEELALRQVGLALRRRLDRLREGGPDPERSIQTCITKPPSGASSKFLPYHEATLRDPNRYGNRKLYPRNTQVIEWDQETLVIDSKRSRGSGLAILSSAATLLHEQEHAISALYDPVGHVVRRSIPSSTFKTQEEKRVILGMEAQVHDALGLNRRVSHVGWTLRGNGKDVTSCEPMFTVKRGNEVELLSNYEITGKLITEGIKPGEIGIKTNDNKAMVLNYSDIVMIMEMNLPAIVQMTKDCRFPPKTARQILEDAILHGDEVTLQVKKDAYKNGELPTLQNSAQLKRFIEDYPQVKLLDRKPGKSPVESVAKVVKSKLFGTSKAPASKTILVTKDGFGNYPNIRGKIVSADEVKNEFKNNFQPKKGYVYIKEKDPVTKERRFFEICAFPFPVAPDQLVETKVELSFRRALANDNDISAGPSRSATQSESFDETKALKSELSGDNFTVIDATPGTAIKNARSFRPDGADKIYFVEEKKDRHESNEPYRVFRLTEEQVHARGISLNSIKKTRTSIRPDSFTVKAPQEIKVEQSLEGGKGAAKKRR